MAEAMKVTCRSSRGGLAKHNDRQFDLSEAPHIDTTKTARNVYWHCYKRTDPTMTFEQAELAFYNSRYSKSLELQNERHRASRHYNRVRTMEAVVANNQTRPDETVLQIGNADNNKHVTRRDFAACVNEYMSKLTAWSKAHGNHVHLLDCSIHADETSYHAHLRTIIDYTDADGVVHVGQEEGLAQAGFEPPKPDEKVDRKNNRKQPYSAMCREMWADICEAHGYVLDRVPNPDHQTHMDTPEWKQYAAAKQKLTEDQQKLTEDKQKLTEDQQKLAEDQQKLADKNTQADEMLAEASTMLTEASNREAKANAAIAQAGQMTERLTRYYRREGLRLPDDVARTAYDFDKLADEITQQRDNTGMSL